jgi:hypothetical protein
MELIPEDKAKQLTEIFGDLAIEVANQVLITHSMYLGNLNPKWKYWNDVTLILAKQ